MQLRPRQIEALECSNAKRKDGVLSQLIVCPTGFGKTVLFSSIPSFFNLAKKMLVLVHREELATQARDKIQNWNPTLSVGVEMASSVHASGDAVVVASVQTLTANGCARLAQFVPDEYEVVVCDEAHHATADSYKLVFKHFGFLSGDSGDCAGRVLVGVTATPNRGDRQGLGQVFDEIVYEYSMLAAIQEGWLCEPRGLLVRTTTSLDGVQSRAGDFATGELAQAVNTPQRNRQIVKEWLNHGEQRQTVAFCVDVQHAKDLALEFQQQGVHAAAIWANDPARGDKLAGHRREEIKVITNCGILTEGYDDWRIGCIILARPTKSQLLFVQMVGRGARLPDGVGNLIEARAAGQVLIKEDFLVMDVTDNCRDHSLITLPSVFGLPAKLNPDGMKITELAAIIEAAQEQNPDADLSELDDIANLRTYVERVNLFEMKWPEEVLELSELAWHKTPQGNFFLMLPGNERVTIMSDILDNWKVYGTIKGKKFSEVKGSIGDAFTFADFMLKMFGRDLLSRLRRNAPKSWSQDKPTSDQVISITHLLKHFNQPPPDFSKLSRGQASEMMHTLIKKRTEAA